MKVSEQTPPALIHKLDLLCLALCPTVSYSVTQNHSVRRTLCHNVKQRHEQPRVPTIKPVGRGGGVGERGELWASKVE